MSLTNERSIESVILHAKNLVAEANEDDGWVMIAAGLLSTLLGEIDRQKSAEPVSDCPKCGVAHYPNCVEAGS